MVSLLICWKKYLNRGKVDTVKDTPELSQGLLSSTINTISTEKEHDQSHRRFPAFLPHTSGTTIDGSQQYTSIAKQETSPIFTLNTGADLYAEARISKIDKIDKIGKMTEIRFSEMDERLSLLVNQNLAMQNDIEKLKSSQTARN